MDFSMMSFPVFGVDATFWLSAIYALLLYFGIYDFVSYRKAYYDMKKDRHILSIAFLSGAIAFTGGIRLISVYLIFIKQYYVAYPWLASLWVMVLPEAVLLVALLWFHHTTFHKAGEIEKKKLPDLIMGHIERWFCG